ILYSTRTYIHNPSLTCHHSLMHLYVPTSPAVLLSSQLSVPPLHLPSLPTRRSSDLPTSPAEHYAAPYAITEEFTAVYRLHSLIRSEEHTSELQSLTNLVCRLLLEKKKITKYNKSHNSSQSNTVHSFFHLSIHRTSTD